MNGPILPFTRESPSTLYGDFPIVRAVTTVQGQSRLCRDSHMTLLAQGSWLCPWAVLNATVTQFYSSCLK